MEKYLVTGGAGFIGSHLCDLLLAKGHSVFVIDNLSSGYKSNLPSNDIRLSFLEKNVEDVDICQFGELDGVFHLAAQASVPLSVEKLFESSKTNLLSSLRVVDYCRNKNIPLLYASSSAVYGELPCGDDKQLDVVELTSPYAVDKFTLEKYAEMAYKLYGMSSIGLRFFNVYGPRQDPSNPYSGVISIFVERLLSNREVTVNGGSQTRDFIYVKDIVNVIWQSMQLARKRRVCEVLNVCTGISVSINELLTILSTILNLQPKTIYKELPPGDPAISLGKSSKLEDTLGIKVNQFMDLSHGLKETISYIATEK
jgi:UDP-glucose 4-epimerase